MNSRIQVFTSAGAFLRSFGSIGTNTGQFSFSGPIAIDSSNKFMSSMSRVLLTTTIGFRVSNILPVQYWHSVASSADGRTLVASLRLQGVLADLQQESPS